MPHPLSRLSAQPPAGGHHAHQAAEQGLVYRPLPSRRSRTVGQLRGAPLERVSVFVEAACTASATSCSASAGSQSAEGGRSAGGQWWVPSARLARCGRRARSFAPRWTRRPWARPPWTRRCWTKVRRIGIHRAGTRPGCQHRDSQRHRRGQRGRADHRVQPRGGDHLRAKPRRGARQRHGSAAASRATTAGLPRRS
jgi:hypothetical protein